MIYSIVSQLFGGTTPNIHDVIIAVVSFLFAVILLPQLGDVYKKGVVLNLYTASITTIGLAILTINFAIMGFWISFAADFFNAVVWGLIFVFSVINLKRKKN